MLVSGGGTNLKALLEDGNPWGDVVLVVASQPGIGALDIARAHGVETVVVSGRELGDAFARRLIEVLTSHDIDLIVLAGYLTILPPEVVAAYPRRIVNVHPALLPSFGGPGFYGLRVHEAALARGVKVTGATVHYVDDVPDHGEIIAQKAVDVLPDDIPETLQRRVMQQAEWVLLPKVVRDLCRELGTSSCQRQDPVRDLATQPEPPSSCRRQDPVPFVWTSPAGSRDPAFRGMTVGEALGGNTYPGRGIVVGMTPDGTRLACAYFIMGRSANSRNRVLVEQDGAIFTRPVDESKVTDPSLIIYAALRVAGGVTALTNGDQTDTIVAALASGGTFEDALRTRDFEPDAPNFTSRISALIEPDARRYRLSQLRELHGTTLRAFWEYAAVPGVGHMIHTYAGDGNPLPPFTGEPVPVAVRDDQEAWANEVWDALDEANRISLMTRFIPLDGGDAVTRIINGKD